MPLEPTTFRGFGAVPISQAAGTLVVSITPLTAGRYKIWGSCRHTLADGIRLVATGSSNMIISQTANQNVNFGPIVLDMNTGANTVLLELQVATGGADTASGNLFVQKLT